MLLRRLKTLRYTAGRKTSRFQTSGRKHSRRLKYPGPHGVIPRIATRRAGQAGELGRSRPMTVPPLPRKPNELHTATQTVAGPAGRATHLPPGPAPYSLWSAGRPRGENNTTPANAGPGKPWLGKAFKGTRRVLAGLYSARLPEERGKPLRRSSASGSVVPRSRAGSRVKLAAAAAGASSAAAGGWASPARGCFSCAR